MDDVGQTKWNCTILSPYTASANTQKKASERAQIIIIIMAMAM